MKPADQKRVAIVCGGSSGIGLATVDALLEKDFKVGFFGHNPAHVEHALGTLSRFATATEVFASTVNVRNADEITAFARTTEDSLGSIDTLVYCVGISPKGEHGALPFEDIGIDEWHDVLQVNLTGAFLCCQAVLPQMKLSRFGRIIVIGSVAGRTAPRIAGASYVASKAALAGLCRSLVMATAGYGITTNLVAPGRILTDMTGPVDSPQNRDALDRIPAGRFGRPADIAATVAFLASHDASFINGAILDVNGGEYLPT